MVLTSRSAPLSIAPSPLIPPSPCRWPARHHRFDLNNADETGRPAARIFARVGRATGAQLDGAFVLAKRQALHSALLAAVLAVLAVPACAQGKLDAQYSVTLAGIQILSLIHI